MPSPLSLSLQARGSPGEADKNAREYRYIGLLGSLLKGIVPDYLIWQYDLIYLMPGIWHMDCDESLWFLPRLDRSPDQVILPYGIGYRTWDQGDQTPEFLQVLCSLE